MITDINDFNQFIKSKLKNGVYGSVFYNQLIQIESGSPLVLGNTDFSEFRLFHILDTVSYLEKGTPESFTKKEKKLLGRLEKFYHKHIYNSRSFDYIFCRDLQNINIVEEEVKRAYHYAKSKGIKTLRDILSYFLVIDREHLLFERKKITGEWIVFYKGSTRNIYLTLASHNETDDEILKRISSMENEYEEI